MSLHARDQLLVRVVRGGGWPAVGLGVAGLAATVAAVALPALLGGAVDAALDASQGRATLWLLVALVLVASVAEMCDDVLAARVGANAAVELRHDTVDRVLAAGLPGQRVFEPGDLLSRLLQGAGSAAGIGPALIAVAASTVKGIAGVVALTLIDWRLPLVLVLGTPAVLVIGRVFMRRTTNISTEYQQIHGQIASRFVDALIGARTIRASGTLDHEVRRVLAPLDRLRESGLRMWEARRQLNWQVALLGPVLQVGVLATAGLGVVAGRISPGQVVATMGYLGLAMGLLRQTMVVAQLGERRGGAQRVSEVLQMEAGTRGGGRPLPSGSGRLTLRGVTVAHDGQVLLDGVDLEVPAGSVMAVVGNSGAGKSTLGAIAGGLLEPDEGTVELDGVPLGDLAPDELRAAVSYAFEVPHLLGDTIADAIAYGAPGADAARVERASRHARIHDFVSRLPHGYDTPLADVRMSGGERQRLGLARAAARDARLVILDDAMSSLDTATEMQVAQALDDGLAGSTRLVVAHRASSAARADAVAWLADGAVRAVAPHEVLWGEADYRRLFGAADEDGLQTPGEVRRPWETTAR